MADNPPLARRMPGFEARHATRRARRIRSVGAIVVVVAVAAFLVVHFTGHSTRPPAAPRRPTATPTPRVVTTLATWRLGAPISRAVVLPGTAAGGTHLVILGGTTTGGLTASGAFDLNVTDGTLTQVGDLMTTLDDACGAVLSGQATVFGGTATPSTSASSSVQSLPATATAGSAPAGTAVPMSTALGTLPQARAAATAVTAGPTTYLVGGDNVAGPVAAVVATTDGRHFTTVASLPVPVLFPALAVVGHTLYVFGGTAADGSEAGRPVTTIQAVNVTTGKVNTSGHLPEPLTGSAAAVLGHDVILAGGDTTSSPGTAASSTTASSTTATVVTTSLDTIWSFNPTTKRSTEVGHLAVAVSHSGMAVLASTAWLVGGESNGTPVSAVQSFVVAPATT